MKKALKITIVFCSFLISASVFGQTAAELLREDPSRAANVDHSYEAPAVIFDTPAPEGYEAFYVSHYGRHGSRYHASGSYFKSINPIFDSLHVHGLLTELGENLRNELLLLTAEEDGLDGILTQKGSREHQEISQRMFERIPEVFQQENRKEILAVSSPVQRCIQSMANFSVQLKGNATQLHFSFYTGDRFLKYIAASSSSRGYSTTRARISDSILVSKLNPEHFINSIITNPAEGRKYFGRYTNDCQFADAVFYAGGIGQCFDIEDPNIFKYFTFDELYALWWHDSAKWYDTFCHSVENGGSSDDTGRPILKDIVDKADEALLDTSDKAADLRFGHDAGLAAFFSFAQFEGYEVVNVADSPNFWYGFDKMPMGSNVQFIFYKNADNDILVKILRNEKETSIPAVKTSVGPYYKWSDLREFFVSLIGE